MKNFNSAIFVAFLSLGLISIKPAAGQDNAALNLWLDVAQSLTEDALTEVSKVQLPNFAPPTLNIPKIVSPPPSPPVVIAPTPPSPCPNTPIYVTSPVVSPVPAPAPSPSPALANLQQQIYYYLVHQNPKVSPPSVNVPPILNQTPPAPATTTQAPQIGTTSKPCGPCGPKPCEPEKVRIVVVSDCDDKSKESESSESSEESEVIIPVRSSKRVHYHHH